MSDWIVWPIFLVEFFAVLLLFMKKDSTLFSISPRKIILGILLLCCIVIGISLYHDSTTILHLHF